MKDPVCGMAVDEGTAAAAWEHEGTTYLFCSVGCMRRFREDPAHFLVAHRRRAARCEVAVVYGYEMNKKALQDRLRRIEGQVRGSAAHGR